LSSLSAEPGGPRMPTETEDVIVLLEDEDASIQRMLFDFCHRDEKTEGDGAALSGDLAKSIVHRCAVQDEVKEEVVVGLLEETGHRDIAERVADNSSKRRELVAKLAEFEAGVSPRYIQVAAGDEFDATVAELARLLDQHLAYEREEVGPVLRREVSAERRKELASELDRSRRRADPHPRPDQKAPSDRSVVSRRVHAAMSRLRDVGDRANHDLGRR